MRKTIIAAAAAFITLAVSSCVRIDSSVLEEGLQPVPAESVQIYTTGEEAPPHKKVAILYAEGTSFNNRKSVFEKLRKKAGELGANGLIINPMRESRDHAFGGEKNQTEAVAIFITPEIEEQK